MSLHYVHGLNMFVAWLMMDFCSLYQAAIALISIRIPLP